jgi:hypothetical protein
VAAAKEEGGRSGLSAGEAREEVSMRGQGAGRTVAGLSAWSACPPLGPHTRPRALSRLITARPPSPHRPLFTPQVARLLEQHLRQDARSWEDVARATEDWYDWVAGSPALLVAALQALCRAQPRGLQLWAGGTGSVRGGGSGTGSVHAGGGMRVGGSGGALGAGQQERLQGQALGSLDEVEGADVAVALGMDPVAWVLDGDQWAAPGERREGGVTNAARGAAAVASQLLSLARRQLPSMEPKVRAFRAEAIPQPLNVHAGATTQAANAGQACQIPSHYRSTISA